MAASTTTNLDGELLRIYSREKLFEPLERTDTPFLTEMEEADDEIPNGARREFRIIARMGHATGNPAEDGDYTAAKTRTVLKGVVKAAQIDASMELSEFVINAGEGDGSFSGDVVHDSVMECTKNLMSYAQVLLAVGHGTGRLVIVEATTIASTSFVGKLPEGIFQLRVGMTIQFADTDTGGSIQANTTGEILAIDFATRTVTLDTSMSLTAGWGGYKLGVYSNPIPNGVRNIVDDGDFASDIFTLTRATYPNVLNAQVDKNGGILRAYSEFLIRSILSRTKTMAGLIPTVLRCNQGIIGEHYRVTVPDRVYQVVGKTETAGFQGGFDHTSLAFQYGSTRIPFKTDEDLPARELYGLHMPSWKKHTLRKPGWVTKDGKILHPTPSSSGGTYKYTWIGAQLWQVNITCRKLNANLKVSWIIDRESAGDA